MEAEVPQQQSMQQQRAVLEGPAIDEREEGGRTIGDGLDDTAHGRDHQRFLDKAQVMTPNGRDPPALHEGKQQQQQRAE